MFEYNLKFRKTDAHANADALSRLPLPVTAPPPVEPTELVLLSEHLSHSPVSVEQIREQTGKDPNLAPVPKARLAQHDGQELPTHTKRKEELSLFEGCLLWGARVVIPRSYFS